MDKYDFISMIAEQFQGLKSEEEIMAKAKKMMAIIISQAELAKGYIKADIL
jgi:hypothetical protein